VLTLCRKPREKKSATTPAPRRDGQQQPGDALGVADSTGQSDAEQRLAFAVVAVRDAGQLLVVMIQQAELLARVGAEPQAHSLCALAERALTLTNGALSALDDSLDTLPELVRATYPRRALNQRFGGGEDLADQLRAEGSGA